MAKILHNCYNIFFKRYFDYFKNKINLYHVHLLVNL